MFYGFNRRVYFFNSYINNSDLNVGKCFYLARVAGGLAALRAGHERQVTRSPTRRVPSRHLPERLLRIDLWMSW